jgi:hypothetical protein
MIRVEPIYQTDDGRFVHEVFVTLGRVPSRSSLLQVWWCWRWHWLRFRYARRQDREFGVVLGPFVVNYYGR